MVNGGRAVLPKHLQGITPLVEWPRRTSGAQPGIGGFLVVSKTVVELKALTMVQVVAQ